LPPLCPVAKGKKVLFVFILEVLDGDGPKPGSFWIALKKCCHPSLSLKMPEVPSCDTPVVKATAGLTLV